MSSSSAIVSNAGKSEVSPYGVFVLIRYQEGTIREMEEDERWGLAFRKCRGAKKRRFC